MSDKFNNILSLIKNRLESSSSLSGVTVITEDANDIENEIQRALGGLNLYILVGNPKFTNEEPDSRVNPNGDLSVPIEVYENVTLNRGTPGYKTCREIAWLVMRRMVRWKPGAGYFNARVQSAEPIISLEHQIYEVRVDFQIEMTELND